MAASISFFHGSIVVALATRGTQDTRCFNFGDKASKLNPHLGPVCGSSAKPNNRRRTSTCKREDVPGSNKHASWLALELIPQARLQELSRQLAALPGDTLLTSAAALFAGPLGAELGTGLPPGLSVSCRPSHRTSLECPHPPTVFDRVSLEC